MTQPNLFPLPPAPAEVLEVAEPAAANPYAPGSRDWSEWAMGWQDGRERASEPPWEWWAYLYPERFAGEVSDG